MRMCVRLACHRVHTHDSALHTHARAKPSSTEPALHADMNHAARAMQAIRRFCYTTPKSYLELISLYKTLLARKREALASAKDRLVSGVEKIAQASAQVRAMLPLGDAAELYLSVSACRRLAELSAK